jgi:hypothetical protein
MSLADHYGKERGAGGKYLDAGEYDVVVTEYRCFTSNSGTRGVELVVADPQQRTSKATFWLTEKALPILASFAEACGISQQEARSYNDANEASNQIFVNRRVRVVVEKGDDGYHKITDWKPATGAPAQTSAQAMVSQAEQAVMAREETLPTVNPEDIPF